MKKLSILIALLIIITVSSKAWALHFIYPKESDTLYIGSEVTFIVKPDEDESWDYVYFGFNQMNYNAKTNDYRFTTTIAPGTPLGLTDNLIVTGIDPDGSETSIKGKAIIKLPLDTSFQSLKIEPEMLILFKMPPEGDPKQAYIFETEKLSVMGINADGTEQDISSSNSGTKYKSHNKDVVTVDLNGKVFAVNVGKTKITVKNGRLEETIKVYVEVYKSL